MNATAPDRPESAPAAAPLFEGSGAFQRPPGGEAARLVAEDETALRAAFWRSGQRGTIFHFTGRTEFIEKHYEPIGRLLRLGFSVATLDWRGQGLSERPLDDRRKGHVERFADFQMDVDALVVEARRREMPEPWAIFAHSMGGAIAARTLMRQAQTPGPRWRAKCAVLSAPMLGLHGSPPYIALSKLIIRAAILAGREESYAPGGGPAFYAAQGFEDNVLSSDPQRFADFAAFLSAHPELGIGGPTHGWVRQAMLEMPQLKPTRTPMLLLLGSDERVVSPKAIRRFVAEANAAELLELDGARHEPLMETDFIQAQIWPAADRFFASQGM